MCLPLSQLHAFAEVFSMEEHHLLHACHPHALCCMSNSHSYVRSQLRCHSTRKPPLIYTTIPHSQTLIRCCLYFSKAPCAYQQVIILATLEGSDMRFET